MTARLCEAIERRWLVMFEYGDLIRVVEPHRVGVNSAGHAMLSGWLRAGYSRSDPSGGWRSYLLGDVSELQILSAPFAGPRPGYAPHDPRMREVFCQLDAAPSARGATSGAPYVVSDSTSATGMQPNADVSAADAATSDTRTAVIDEPAQRSP